MSWYKHSDLGSIGSRFTASAVFVMPGWYEAGTDLLDPSLLEAEDWESDFAPYSVKREVVGIGRGASGSALAVYLVEGLIAVGGIKGGIEALKAVARLWGVLRKRHPGVTLSHGAAQAMAALQILQSEPGLHLADLLMLPVVDVNPSDKTELNHTGIDMMLVAAIDAGNTRSWVFLIDAKGKLLHSSTGGALPNLALFYLGVPIGDADFRDEPGDYFLGLAAGEDSSSSGGP